MVAHEVRVLGPVVDDGNATRYAIECRAVPQHETVEETRRACLMSAIDHVRIGGERLPVPNEGFFAYDDPRARIDAFGGLSADAPQPQSKWLLFVHKEELQLHAGVGHDCSHDVEACARGQVCRDGKCALNPGWPEGAMCKHDGTCASGLCRNSRCTCTDDFNCTINTRCEPTTGACVPLRPHGAPCAHLADCAIDLAHPTDGRCRADDRGAMRCLKAEGSQPVNAIAYDASECASGLMRAERCVARARE